MSESKYQASFELIILGQNPLTSMIPIYNTTVLYDLIKLHGTKKGALCTLFFDTSIKLSTEIVLLVTLNF